MAATKVAPKRTNQSLPQGLQSYLQSKGKPFLRTQEISSQPIKGLGYKAFSVKLTDSNRQDKGKGKERLNTRPQPILKRTTYAHIDTASLKLYYDVGLNQPISKFKPFIL